MSKHLLVLFFMLILPVGMLYSQTATADSENGVDLEVYGINNAAPWYNPNAAEIQCTNATEQFATNAPGSDNLVKIYNYFLAKGASQQAAAAITGSIWQESKGNPTVLQGGGNTTDPSNVGLYKDGRRFQNKPGDVSLGKAWGLLQWDPGNAALYWQEQSGVQGDIAKLETQLAVTWWHLTERAPTSQSNVLAKIEAAPSLESAVEVMSKSFFGCGDCKNSNRISAAKTAMEYEIDPAVEAALTETQAEQANMSQNCSSEQAELDASDSSPISPNASGYARPLKGYELASHLETCTGRGCHAHDQTYAFDLIVKPGTEVTAIFDGEIFSNKEFNVGSAGKDPKCRSVQFKGDDGWIYWYGHTYINHPAGTKFKAGEVMGVIGGTDCGFGTPHLHIDRGSPKGHTGGEDKHRDSGFIKLLQDIYAGK